MGTVPKRRSPQSFRTRHRERMMGTGLQPKLSKYGTPLLNQPLVPAPAPAPAREAAAAAAAPPAASRLPDIGGERKPLGKPLERSRGHAALKTVSYDTRTVNRQTYFNPSRKADAPSQINVEKLTNGAPLQITQDRQTEYRTNWYPKREIRCAGSKHYQGSPRRLGPDVMYW